MICVWQSGCWQMEFLEQSIQYLPGVGPRIARILEKEAGVKTVDDLMRYYPYKHIDRTRFYLIRDIKDEQTYMQIKGQIIRFEYQGEGKKTRLTALFGDGYNTIELVWNT